MEEDQLSDTHMNNILLTESEIEEILNDLHSVLPKIDKKDRKRKSEDDESPPFQKRKSVIVHTSNVPHIEKEKNPENENQHLQNKNNPIIDKQQDPIIKKDEKLRTLKIKLFQSSYIPTPTHLKRKRIILNIDNNSKKNDEKSFLWSVLAHLFPSKINPSKVFKYKKYLNRIKYDGINMPMKIEDIDEFEKMNNLIINVYGCTENGKEIWPRRISKKEGKEAINLLMLDNGKKYHYVLIKSLKRLFEKTGKHSKN